MGSSRFLGLMLLAGEQERVDRFGWVRRFHLLNFPLRSMCGGVRKVRTHTSSVGFTQIFFGNPRV